MGLEKRQWTDAERAAWLADKIVTGASDYCNEAADLLRKFPAQHESAFPQTVACGSLALSEGGMTLRDYFAAKAMQAFWTGATADELYEEFGTRSVARAAYIQADEMLKARGETH